MICSFEITEEQLLKALFALQKCKEKGFIYSNAIFSLTSMNVGGIDVMASFSEAVILKSDPKNKNKNWGNVKVKENCPYILKDGECIYDENDLNN